MHQDDMMLQMIVVVGGPPELSYKYSLYVQPTNSLHPVHHLGISGSFVSCMMSVIYSRPLYWSRLE